jgi:hypothetical protein
VFLVADGINTSDRKTPHPVRIQQGNSPGPVAACLVNRVGHTAAK